GRRALCLDANPIGPLIGRVKTTPLSRTDQREINALRSFVDSSRETPLDHQELLATFEHFIPNIPNRTKWFTDISCAELALLRSQIARLESRHARDLALLALSRIVLKASNQDSE